MSSEHLNICDNINLIIIKGWNDVISTNKQKNIQKWSGDREFYSNTMRGNLALSVEFLHPTMTLFINGMDISKDGYCDEKFRESTDFWILISTKSKKTIKNT